MDSNNLKSIANRNIKTYVNFHVKRLFHDWSGENACPPEDFDDLKPEEVKATIKERSGNTFLWLSLVLKELSRPCAESIWCFKECLNEFPKGLEMMYTCLTDGVPEKDRQEVRALLQWVTICFGSLTIQDLSVALGTTRAHIQHLITSCGSLLYLDDGSIDLELLRATSITILHKSRTSREVVSFQNVPNPTLKEKRTPPLVLYALKYWPKHYALASSGKVDLSTSFFAARSKERDAWCNSYRRVVSAIKIQDMVILPPEVPSISLLHLASFFGIFDLAERTLSKTQDYRAVNERDNVGNTPLGLAILSGSEKVAELLLANKADANTKNGHGKRRDGCCSPLHYSALTGNERIVSMLLKRKGRVTSRDAYGTTPLSRAAEKGNLKVVQVLLQQDAVPSSRSNGGETPLHEAAKSGWVELARTPLKCPEVDHDAMDEFRHTPLHLAAVSGHLEFVELLLALELGRVDVNSATSFGETALVVAAKVNYPSIVEALLRDSRTKLDLQPLGEYLEPLEPVSRRHLWSSRLQDFVKSDAKFPGA